MSLPRSQSQTIGDVVVEARSFKHNFFFFRSIGGEVTVRGSRRKRRWWCLWLCKTPVAVEADRIEIENRYFAHVVGTPFLVDAASHEKACSDCSDCTLKHWAVGIGVKLEFPDGSGKPSTVSDLLPLDGVMSRARVDVAGSSLTFETAAGSHPD
jgi:hypothetical protein